MGVDISTELAAIMTAVYGEEVRGSIHDAIEKMHQVVEEDVTVVDPNLQTSGAAADAKVVGDTVLRFRGALDDCDLNTVETIGIYRLSSSHTYSNYPGTTKTGWLFVFKYGSTGNSITQWFIETGVSASRMYTTYMRSANTSTIPYKWGIWQSSGTVTDSSLEQEGIPADALAVGERLSAIESRDFAEFLGNLPTVDLNDVVDAGIYRLVSSATYTNSPGTTKTGWLFVFASGSAGNSVTQWFIESGVNSRVYYTYMRTANTSGSSMVWSSWQSSFESMTDDTLTQENIPADAKAVGDRLADLEFVPIDITSFTVNPNVAEKGATINNATFTWRINKTPASLKLGTESITPVASGNYSKSLNITGDQVYTLQASDTGSPSKAATNDSMSTNIYFRNKLYYGAAAAPATINDTFLLGLANKELAASRAKTFTVTAGSGAYIWYALPTAYGTPNFNVGGFDGGFRLIETISHRNASGHTENYAVWRSDNPSLGSTKVVVS